MKLLLSICIYQTLHTQSAPARSARGAWGISLREMKGECNACTPMWSANHRSELYVTDPIYRYKRSPGVGTLSHWYLAIQLTKTKESSGVIDKSTYMYSYPEYKNSFNHNRRIIEPVYTGIRTTMKPRPDARNLTSGQPDFRFSLQDMFRQVTRLKERNQTKSNASLDYAKI